MAPHKRLGPRVWLLIAALTQAPSSGCPMQDECSKGDYPACDGNVLKWCLSEELYSSVESTDCTETDQTCVERNDSADCVLPDLIPCDESGPACSTDGSRILECSTTVGYLAVEGQCGPSFPCVEETTGTHCKYP
jgi:hypothetical protein